jgi:predicted transcriptional regulator
MSTTDTSRAANRSVEHVKPLFRERLLDMIRAANEHGVTCDELEAISGLRHQTASARVNELAKVGSIVDSGTKRTTRSGRKATVWRAK